MAGEFTKFATVASVLNQAMGELGLTPPASYFGSTDQNAIQFVALLTATGQELCTMNDWQMLHKEGTINLVANTLNYSLPTDWNSFVDSTLWDNTARWPALGPVTPQVWRELKARLLGANTVSLQYRIVGNQIVFYSVPSSDVLAFDYYSRGWLLQSDATTYRDNVSADDNQILFDQRIIIPFLKLKWRTAKGFDTTADLIDFRFAWDTVVGRDSPAPTLSIGPINDYPLLSMGNVSDTGYGA